MQKACSLTQHLGVLCCQAAQRRCRHAEASGFWSSMQGAGKPVSGLGGTAFLMTSGPNLAVRENPAARLLAWAITNTSTLAQAVR